MIVTTTKGIVVSTILNQCYGKEWLLSEATVDLVWIYTYLSGDDADEYGYKQLDRMVEYRGNFQAAENLSRNLLEVHWKIRNRVQYKLANVLTKMLGVPASTRYHFWFALFLDPRYVMDRKDIKTFHQRENLDTKTIVQQMMP